MTRFNLIAICLLLSGCVTLPQRAKTSMIGMSRGDLLSCAGVPDKREELPDREILQFEQNDDVQGAVKISTPFSFDVKLGGEGTCHAVITLREGVVSGVGYTGPSRTLLGPYAACSPILRGCVNLRE